MKHVAIVIMSFSFSIAAYAVETNFDNEMAIGDVTAVSSKPLATVGIVKTVPLPLVVDANAFYSNITTEAGGNVTNGGATSNITRLVCDDVTYDASAGARTLVGYRFTVTNANAASVTARARIRFFQDNSGFPGTLIGGSSLTPLSFPGSSANTLHVTLSTALPFPGTGSAVHVWACITFDDNTGGTGGATGITTAELNNLGQDFIEPVDRGSSANEYFVTTNPGSFFASNPTGSLVFSSVHNFGWELLQATAFPVTLQSFTVD